MIGRYFTILNCEMEQSLILTLTLILTLFSCFMLFSSTVHDFQTSPLLLIFEKWNAHDVKLTLTLTLTLESANWDSATWEDTSRLYSGLPMWNSDPNPNTNHCYRKSLVRPWCEKVRKSICAVNVGECWVNNLWPWHSHQGQIKSRHLGFSFMCLDVISVLW